MLLAAAMAHLTTSSVWWMKHMVILLQSYSYLNRILMILISHIQLCDVLHQGGFAQLVLFAGLGLLVFPDIVHSYSAADEMVELSLFDGSNDYYFHTGNCLQISDVDFTAFKSKFSVAPCFLKSYTKLISLSSLRRTF